jgi:hypothetical protein
MNSPKHIAVLLAVVVGATGCCDENVKILVLAGHQEARTCIQAVKDGKSSLTTVACGGKEVTVCWGSNVKDVKLDPLGITSHGTAVGSNFVGVEYFKPTASVTVKATASDCASASQDVTVISGDTPVRFDAGWQDPKCQLISYNFDPLFIDPDARSISITGLWFPNVPDSNGNPVVCKTPPYLKGFKKPDLFGFNVDEPQITKSFSAPLTLAGDWIFTPEFTCPPGNYVCNQYAAFPFSTTVRCPASP